MKPIELIVHVTISSRRLGRERRPSPRRQRNDGTQLLMKMGPAAKYLGVSRVTLWRMIRDGRLKQVELMPGSFRICRQDLEKLAASGVCSPTAPVE